MIKTYKKSCINMSDVCEHFHTKIEDYMFTEMAENDSYINFKCDKDSFVELKELIDEDLDPIYPSYKCYINDYNLMSYLRKELHIAESCLIYISW